MSSTLYSFPVLWNLNFLDRFLKKFSNTKFHENPPSGSRVDPSGHTHRHDEANSRFFFLAILQARLIKGTLHEDLRDWAQVAMLL